ncbi:MAG: hypothetical protein IIA07_12910 [Proteobacteria bacterium]|nr:hypothetical protein [Pseudomonadota bacterium]
MTTCVAKSRLLLVQMVILLMSVPPQLAAAGPLPSETKPILAEDADNVAALNVSITVFDPGVPADPRMHRDQQVFPRIREIEATFLPFVLREALAETNAWGAVRVVPQPDIAAELLVSGSIVRSDGEILELNIRAVDASGRVWLDRSFVAAVENQELYFKIVAALQTARAQLSNKALRDVVEISLLRYANQLAPSAFGAYLHEAADGTFTIIRLPARNDPMLGRIDRLRRIEYVITDAVDAKFQELHAEIASTYDLWREYRRKVIEYQVEDVRRAQDTESDAPRGSYEAMKNRYDNYKWNRITAQEQESLAVAFNNEIGPKVDAMEARVAELQGWVDQKYAEWHRLLEELFEVETGLR